MDDIKALRILINPARSSLERAENSSDHRWMEIGTRTYRFTLTVNIEEGHPAYDDPDWVADAAWGSLTNEYGLRTICSGVEQIDPVLDL